MSKTRVFLLVAAILVGLPIYWHNRLVSGQEEIVAKSAIIDVQLKRRADLIGNLVESVKGYARHETDLIQSVSNARSKLVGAVTANEKAEANEAVSGALSRLIMVAESYPELKADANFRQLSDELAGTENRIAVARIDYNNAVSTYNRRIAGIPGKYYAESMGLERMEYFTAEKADTATPSISF